MMRVLVIEDEAVLREGLKRELEAAGHTVDVAADPEDPEDGGSDEP